MSLLINVSLYAPPLAGMPTNRMRVHI